MADTEDSRLKEVELVIDQLSNRFDDIENKAALMCALVTYAATMYGKRICCEEHMAIGSAAFCGMFVSTALETFTKRKAH